VELELLITREEIQDRVKELGRQISKDLEGTEPVFVGVLNGVIFFFADLLRQLAVPASIDFIRAASYGSSTTSSGNIQLTKDVEISIRGRPVVLVEDIVDTGLTLNHIVDLLKGRSPESLRVCVLIDKLERREIQVDIDYWGFRVKEGFIVGYGLDCKERYRHLPDIHVIRGK